MSTGDLTVRASEVSKRFRLYARRNNSLKAAVVHRTRGKYEDFWALTDVSFEIEAGETFGLVGHNGSGKSTMLKCIAGLLVPDRGTVETYGRISSVLELGVGFHPELSGRENIFLNGTFFGYSRRDINRRLEDIVSFAGLEDFIDEPVKSYSSGMYARLGFSVATHVDPEILLVDEVLAVGDEEFQRRCIERIVEFRAEGRTIVFVSHALASVRMLCDRVAWLDHGVLRGVGDPSDLIEQYLDVATADMEERGSSERPTGSWLNVLEIIGPNGQTNVLRAGDPVRLRLSWDAPHRVIAPVVGIAIYRHDGVLVYGTDTKIARIEMSVDRGPGAAEFSIPSFRALAGSYHVDIAMAEKWGEKVVTTLQRAGTFSIVGGVDRESAGVFSPPDCQWDVGAHFTGRAGPGRTRAGVPARRQD